MNAARALHFACPKCGGDHLCLMDKGLARAWRMLTGTSRYMCRDCRVTWRRHQPEAIARVARRRHGVLPVHDDGGWKMIILPPGEWSRNMQILSQTVDYLLSMGDSRIKVDISRPQSFSSLVFGTLLVSYKRCKQAGGDLRVCRASQDARDVFSQTSLSFLLMDEGENPGSPIEAGQGE